VPLSVKLLISSLTVIIKNKKNVAGSAFAVSDTDKIDYSVQTVQTFDKRFCRQLSVQRVALVGRYNSKLPPDGLVTLDRPLYWRRAARVLPAMIISDVNKATIKCQGQGHSDMLPQHCQCQTTHNR